MGKSARPRVLELVAKMRNRAVDAAIVDALPHLEGSAAEETLELLIRREHQSSHAALVASFGDMTDPLRTMVVDRATSLHRGVLAAMTSADLDARRAAIRLVVEAKDVASSHALADALRTKCAKTRELAASALLELTLNLLNILGPDGIAAKTTQYAHAYRAHLAGALSDAVSHWDAHHQRPVLEAALLLGDAVEAALLAKLDTPGSHIAHMVAEIIEGATDTRLAGFVLRALAIEQLRKPAASAITRTTNPRFMDAILRQTWLLADPRIEQGCRWLKDGEWSRNWCNAITGDNSTLPSTAIDFITHLGGTHEQRMNRLATLLEAPGQAVQRETLWRLIADHSPEATELLVDFARRTDEPLAELAQRECRRRLGPANSRSPGAESRITALTLETAAQAQVTTPAQVLERFIDEFDHLTPLDRASLGLEITALVNNLPEKLDRYARASAADTRARTVRVAIELGLVTDMSESVYKLAHDPDGRVRAVAVTALREVPGATTTRILRDALNDPEPRVQANAIETLEALGLNDRCDAVSAKLESQNNRVRANSVKALLGMQFEPAAGALLDMLTDASQAHRISALWVVERMRLRSMIDRIVEMSQADPDDRVRDRAARVLRNLAVAGPTGPFSGVVPSPAEPRVVR